MDKVSCKSPTLSFKGRSIKQFTALSKQTFSVTFFYLRSAYEMKNKSISFFFLFHPSASSEYFHMLLHLMSFICNPEREKKSSIITTTIIIIIIIIVVVVISSLLWTEFCTSVFSSSVAAERWDHPSP